MSKDTIQLPYHLGRLYSEDHFLDALRPFGITRRGFRSLLKLLLVPTLHLPGQRRFIDALAFSMAVQAACRPGRGKDFFFPGSGGKKKPSATSYKLSAAEYREYGTAILHEVVATRLITKGTVDKELNKAIRQALKRMASVCIDELPHDEAQARYKKHLDERLKQFASEVFA